MLSEEGKKNEKPNEIINIVEKADNKKEKA